MESPESRPAAAKLIDSVINKHYEDMKGHLVGLSLCMKITNALVEAEYMRDYCTNPLNREGADCPCPYDCSSCHEGDGVCWRGNPELLEEGEDAQ